MATMRRNRRLPGQSSKYRDHPSNVGSPSYFADTGRGWVPNSLPSNYANKPVSPTRRGDNRFAGARQAMTSDPAYRGTRGDNRFAGARQAMTSDPAYRGITATAPGKKYITKATEDEKDQAAFDHRATAHFKPWFANVMDKFGGLTKGAMRGSRLHKSYKDKYGDSKQWEADKKMMASGWDLSSGDPGYEGSDKQFYDKYMNLADMAQDSTKAQEYRDTAETAWRNKQTSDRLAAATGFEDYAPSKYTGVGEGSRYTGDAYEGQGRTGEFVPGVGIMRDIFDRLPAQGGYDMDFGGPFTPTGGPISITDNQFAPGYDQELPAYSDEPVDITRDIGGDDYYTEGELWEDTSNDLYGDALYETGEMMDDEQYSLWGDPGFYDKPVGPRGMLGTERTFADMAKRNSGFVSPFKNVTNLPFNPNALLPRVTGNTVNPNLIDEEETFIKPKTNLRGRLGLYD